MRHFLLCLPLAVASCAKAPPPVPAPPPTPIAPEPVAKEPKELGKLLVMALRPEAGLEESSRALDEMILEAIHDLKQYDVLGPEDLNAVLGVEAMKDAMGCDDVACAAEIGGALGAPYLVAGQLTKLGEQTVLSLRLMDTQAPAVLERSTARGPANADALASMMAAAVGDLFGVELAVTGPTVTPPSPPATGPDYSDYTALMNELARLGSNSEFSQLLSQLDRVEHQKINTPPSVDLKELLVYYRAYGCSMLKRNKCVRNTVLVYQKLWPQGMYASTMQAYVDQLDDTALQRDAQADDVKQKLEDIRRAVKSGAMSPLDGKEAGAAMLMGGRRYPEAAAVYGELVKAYKHKPAKAMELVSMLVMALEFAGEIGKARQVLEESRRRQPRLFRLQGLHHKLRSLPK